MRRIRLVFAFVCAALLACAVPLVRRAFDSVELERAARHDLVSSRIFDEMERALFALVSREEERPFGHYRFYYAPEATVGGKLALTRSPLASLPEAPYLIGYFQIDPDGSLHTPHRPRDESFARRTGDWDPTPDVQSALGELRSVLERHRTRIGARDSIGEDFAAAPQAPGTTVALESAGASRGLRKKAAAIAEDKRERSVYDAVSSLNRGISGRAERQVKVEQRKADEVLEVVRGDLLAPRENAPRAAETPSTEAEATFADAAPPLPSPPRGARAAQAPPTPAEDRSGSLRALGYTLEARSGESDASSATRPEPARERGAEIELTYEPFAGGTLDREHFALVRTVWLGGAPYRQGVLFDLAKLTAHLRRVGIGSNGLSGGAELSFVGAELPAVEPETRPDRYLYQRRFAEPFEDFGARLALAPLPDPGGGTYVYLLSLLLALVGSLGLFALYRMVSVAVLFAERRSNFAAAVSHELKTPLTAIRMYAEMLRDGMVPERKRRQYYGTITAESERLSRLINNVLEFSRLEKGVREMHLRMEPIEPCVREAVETLRPHAERQGFRIELELEDDLPPARFDKYAGSARERVITVACRREGERVALRVRDRGPGIPARHLSRVFDAFYRAENELTRTSKGTGLGLALVQGLVGRMGGVIASRNAEGGGFEVTVALSAAPDA
jgi:signal transduction histidine kinase